MSGTIEDTQPVAPSSPTTLDAGVAIELRDGTRTMLANIERVFATYYLVVAEIPTIANLYPKMQVAYDERTLTYYVPINTERPASIVAEDEGVVLGRASCCEVRYLASNILPYAVRILRTSAKWTAISYGGTEVWYRNASFKVDTRGAKLWVLYEDEHAFHAEPEAGS
jgi:hypothetical protein